MCEQADTFCKNTLTMLPHWRHLKFRMRAGLLMGFGEGKWESGILPFSLPILIAPSPRFTTCINDWPGVGSTVVRVFGGEWDMSRIPALFGSFFEPNNDVAA